MISLSQRLNASIHHLSQVINEKSGKNFFDLINGCRIEEAKTKLKDPSNQYEKILDIAFDVGFNTKVAFNKAFKKFAKMTPSQFRQKYRKR